jgi:uncharacterized protein (TIGR00251 family)
MAITVDILVQPRASRAKIGPMHDGRIKIAVTAPPVDGQANAAVIELLARVLGIARSDITVVAGASSRRKTLRIANVTRARLDELVKEPIDEPVAERLK